MTVAIATQLSHRAEHVCSEHAGWKRKLETRTHQDYYSNPRLKENWVWKHILVQQQKQKTLKWVTETILCARKQTEPLAEYLAQQATLGPYGCYKQ